jgi:RING finger protein 121/175
MEEAQSSITSDGAASSLDHNATAKTNATEGLMTEQELEHSLLVFYLVIFVMLAAQSALVAWRKRHRRSYDLVTLVGLWSIPPIIALYLGFWRFLAIWSLYSGITGNFLYRCAYARSTDKKLPKKVYRWFFSTFKASVAVGVIGYALLLIQIFLSGMLVTPAMDPSWALIACFYGLVR